jgi:tetratricopeptide (TPR) repeat protein
VTLQVERASVADRDRSAMVALSQDAIWIQEVWSLRRIALAHVGGVETGRSGIALAVKLRPEIADERLLFTFDCANSAQHWLTELEARRPGTAEAGSSDQHVPEGVTLVQQLPDGPRDDLGRAEFTGANASEADRGLQLRAGMMGADAVVGVYRCKLPDRARNRRHANGLAVRVPDATVRRQLRERSYAEQVGALVRRILVLLVIQAAVLSLVGLFCAGVSRHLPATGETLSEALASMGVALAMLYTWPLVMLVLLRVLRWPALLRIAGVAVLVVTTGRGLVVWMVHLWAARAAGVHLAGRDILMLLDPVDWAFIIIGAVLCRRAWRLAGDAPSVLPPEAKEIYRGRPAWARGLLGLTAVYALGLLGFLGYSRYQTSAYLLQPGVDPKREHQALLEMNQGLAYLRNAQLAEAERSLQSALRIWEELTKVPACPALYRINLATTLYDLGYIRQERDRLDEAETYYARALAAGGHLVDDPSADGDFKRIMAHARWVVDSMRDQKLGKGLDEKTRLADRKYEEGWIKAQKGEAAAAEPLYVEAIALWEEVLPQVESPVFCKAATIQLAEAYLALAELRLRQNMAGDAEKALLKSIKYGEDAVKLAPDRPIAKHNLDVARRRLDHQREQAHETEIDRLVAAERIADALDLSARGVEELEEQLEKNKGDDGVKRRLAYRLDRYAWLLAHCPDGRGRDTRQAVRLAHRAVNLQSDASEYRYTLATVQYRNGSWQESMTSLDGLKKREGQWEASAWLLVAMNRHRLGQREAAREALREAHKRIEDQQSKAESNPLIRLQLEMSRPALDGLRREAESLIEGKDPTRGVG